METAAPRIYVENHHANLVISLKVSYALLQQDTDTTFLFFTLEDMTPQPVSEVLFHKHYFFFVYAQCLTAQAIDHYRVQRYGIFVDNQKTIFR